MTVQTVRRPLPPPLLRPSLAAALLGVSAATLRRWRTAGTGPGYFAFESASGRGPRIIRYAVSHLNDFNRLRKFPT